MIKKFKLFENENSFDYTGRYLKIKILKNGNLKIVLTPDGKNEIEDNTDFSDFSFNEIFDDIRSNSELFYIDSLSEYNLAMSEAPAITKGYYYDNDNDDYFTDYDNMEDSEIFYYPDYIVKDFTKELYKNGFVIFVTNGRKTTEEIEEIKIGRQLKKFNL